VGEAFCLCEALPTVLQLTSQTALLAIAVPRIVELFVPYQVKYRDSAAPRIRSSFVSYNDVPQICPFGAFTLNQHESESSQLHQTLQITLQQTSCGRSILGIEGYHSRLRAYSNQSSPISLITGRVDEIPHFYAFVIDSLEG